jgi:hypothetical protein
MLSALPRKIPLSDDGNNEHHQNELTGDSRSVSRSSLESRGAMPWRSRNRKLREVGIGTLQWVDGIRSRRWGRPVEPDDEENDEGHPPRYISDPDEEHKIDTHITPLTRKPSGRSKGRSSLGGGEITPVE